MCDKEMRGVIKRFLLLREIKREQSFNYSSVNIFSVMNNFRLTVL